MDTCFRKRIIHFEINCPMKKYKRMLIHLPDYYLIVLAIMAAFTPPFTINPIAIGIVANAQNNSARHSLFIVGLLVGVIEPSGTA